MRLHDLSTWLDKFAFIRNLPEIQPQFRNKVGIVGCVNIFGPLKIIYLEVILANNSIVFCKPEWLSGPMESDEAARIYTDPHWKLENQRLLIHAG